MKPGVTTMPFASITRFPALGSILPILAMCPVLDRQVGVEPRIAATVDNPAVSDDDIIARVGARVLGQAWRTRQRQEEERQERRQARAKGSHACILFLELKWMRSPTVQQIPRRNCCKP